jgi:hypothetical protein
MSVATPHLSSEEIRENSRYLRLLQQLGDHAIREVASTNSVFQQHFAGALAPNKREIIKEQSDVLDAGIGKLAAIAAEEAEAANSHRLAAVLRELAQQPTAIAGCEFELVHPATLRLLKVLDELAARNNYIEISGALYALLKMAPAEKLLHPDENAPQQIRQATHSQVQVAGLPLWNSDEPWDPEPPLEIPGPHAPVPVVIGELELALENYASGYYPLRGCIMPGMDAVIEAKKRFYRELASDFSGELAADDHEGARPPLKVSNFS